MLSLCEYFAEDGGLAPNHFEPWYIVRGIKKDRPKLRGYRDVRVSGRWKRICLGREDVAIEWAAERLGAAADDHFAELNLAIVPIPGSSCASSGSVEASRGFMLADAVAKRFDGDGSRSAIAVPLLHWKKPKPRAHDQGGTRDPAQLAAMLSALKRYRETIGERTIVLIDDVVTSGGSMIACRSYLLGLQHKYAVADLGLAAARTVHVKGTAIETKIEDCPRPDDRPDLF